MKRWTWNDYVLFGCVDVPGDTRARIDDDKFVFGARLDAVVAAARHRASHADDNLGVVAQVRMEVEEVEDDAAAVGAGGLDLALTEEAAGDEEHREAPQVVAGPCGVGVVAEELLENCVRKKDKKET